MKKIILLLLLLSITFSVSAASKNKKKGWRMHERYFELTFDMPFNVSNNAIGVTDIFKKEVVIDLPEISERIPNSGFMIGMSLMPSMNMALNLKSFNMNLRTGVDFQVDGNISKSIVDLITVGNGSSSSFDGNVAMYLDAFAFVDLGVGFYVKTFKVNVTPTVFFPVLHAEAKISSLSVSNMDGKLGFDFQGGIDVYSQFGASALNNLAAIDYASLFSNFGIDLTAGLEYPVFERLSLFGTVHTPIVPAHLKKRTSASMSASGEVDFVKIATSNGSPSFETNSEPFEDRAGEYVLNRPFKASVGADFRPFGEWLKLYGDAGIAFKYPFTSNAKFYFEYTLSVGIDLANIIGVKVTTQYHDMIFAHGIDAFINLRVIEIDLGASLQATSFISSFKLGMGAGAYVAISIGF